MSVRLAFAMILVAGLSVVGCTRAAKLDAKSSYDLSGEEPAKAMILDPQPKAQKLTIDFKSSDGDVTVLVFKDADVPKGDSGLIEADAKKALGQKKGKADSFTVDVPENTGTQIVIRNADKKTKVDLAVNNKK